MKTTKTIRKISSFVLMVCLTAVLLSGTAMAAWSVSGNCRSITTFDVSTKLISLPSITIKPTKCGYIQNGPCISMGNWGDYTIKVKVLKGKGRTQTETTYWNWFDNYRYGTKISLWPNSTYRITVAPKKLEYGLKWSSTASWKLSSASGVKSVTKR